MDNIIFAKHSFIDFCQRVYQKLGLLISDKNFYKICDFKPAYGFIFEELITPYFYWGYSDVDLVFSDLEKFGVIDRILASDIYLGYSNYASGPFTVLKNCKKNNELFKEIYNYEDILTNPELQGMDEHIIKDENRGFSVWKLVLLFKFLLKTALSNPQKIFSVPKLKYDFQWFVKERRITVPVDFTEAIIVVKKRNKLLVRFDPSIKNDSEFVLDKNQNWRIRFDGSKLINIDTGKQYPIFHFRLSKKNSEFTCEDLVQPVFTISAKGIVNG